MPRQSLDKEINSIRDDLLILSSMVETALVESVTALKDHDMERSRIVYDNDTRINKKRFDLEGRIIAAIATQSPVLTDLRFLASAMNISTELERIGDYAKTIARINLISGGISIPALLRLTYDMGVRASEMLHRAMTAFILVNVPSATRIIADDEIVDAMYNALYAGLIDFVVRGAHNMERANYLFWVAHNLERAADRVTNICERTIYLETGEFGFVALPNAPIIKN
jgi:phosphate transport system protein